MENNQRLAIILSMAVVTVWLVWENNRVEQQQAEQAALDAMRQEQVEIVGSEGESGFPEPGRDLTATAGREAESSRAPGTPGGRARDEMDSLAGAQIPLWEGVVSASRYTATLSNEGGGLTSWELSGYQSNGLRSEVVPIELVAPGVAGVAPVTPLTELGYGDLSRERWEVESEEPGRVVFRLERGGLTVRKLYTFDLTDEGSSSGYEFDLEIEIQNDSDRGLESTFAIQWPSTKLEGNDYSEQSVVVLTGEDVEREPIAGVGESGFFDGLFGGGGDGEEIWRDVKWAGADLKYFASLLLPERPEETMVSFAALDPRQTAAVVIETVAQQIAPGSSLSTRLTGYLGPKKPETLEAFGRDLDRSIDLGYSWLEPLTLFFHWLLNFSYSVIPNYGWSIVFITILVRVATLPIMNRQMRSMERMRALQPQLKEIQAEFADDRQKQSEATMALYKESGVNPLGGCLPMLLQFPVFIGLFYALQSSFALRQAPFIGWITDLSAPEMLFMIPIIDLPFRILPVIMGASMILQQKLTPTTVDPSQQMMMMVIMPVMMTVLFYQFPSGLVLYWMISNFLGIGHQLLVGRRMKAAEA